MICLKCNASNADNSEFCGFCYESFKPKNKPKPPVLIIPDITTEFGYWEAVGPLMLTREALYFFVQTCTDVSEKKSMKRQVHKNISSRGILGFALGMALDKSLEEKMPLRPQEVHLKTAHWDKEPLIDWVDHQKTIGSCDEFFMLTKEDVKSIQVDIFGHFRFTTSAAEIKTSAIEEQALLTGFVRSSGFKF